MITVLSGENSFEIKQSLDKIKRSFDGRIENISPDELIVANLPDIFMGQSLFSEKRMIVIRNLSENKIVWPMLGDWLDKISDDIHLILIDSKLDKRTATYKKLKSLAKINEHSLISEKESYKLEKWLSDKSVDMSLSLDKKSIRFLLDRVGADQWRLMSALEKLQLSGDVIDEELIENIIPLSTSDNAFELFEATIKSDSQKVSKLIESLEKTEDVYMLSGLFYSQFSQMAAVFYSVSGGDVAKDFGIHPYVIKKMSSLANYISREKLEKILDILIECDSEIKSVDIDAWLIFEKALYNIISI